MILSGRAKGAKSRSGTQCSRSLQERKSLHQLQKDSTKSMRAALIYQHATADRDQAIAAALSRLATGDVTDAERDGRAGPPLHAQGRARPRATGT